MNYLQVYHTGFSIQNNQIPVYIETPRLKSTNSIINIDDEYYIELEINIENNSGSFFDFLLKSMK